MKAFRAALIGYGLAGATFHAPLIAATPGLSLATIVTGDRERQERARRDHPDAHVVPAVEALWERSAEHDFVVVAAPNSAHVALARAGLDAGLAAVVDKPLATNAADAASLVEHARARDLL